MIGQGQSSIAEFEERLRSLGPADVRLLLYRSAEGHSLGTAVVNAGPDIAAGVDETYDYGEVVFVRAVLDGNRLADWLTVGSGEVNRLTFAVPEPATNCSWIRWESRTPAYRRPPFTTPHTAYEIPSRDSNEPHLSHTLLVGAGLPFFPDINVAAASVLLDIHALPGAWTRPRELMLVRIAHLDAYFEKVRVSSTSIVASVRGENLGDVHLQVSSAGFQHEERVDRPGDVTVRVSGADSTYTWVALTRGRECLDLRTISNLWLDSREQRGVVHEPEDLNERLDLMRRGGENETVEFKEQIPVSGERIARTVAAFANGEGGTIIVGIKDDTGDVAGVADPAGCRDSLVDTVRNKVRPSPRYDLQTCTLEGCPVVAMHVEPGDDRPYGVTGNGGPRYYVRRGATNRVAESEELRAIVQPRQSDSQEPLFRFE